MAQRRLQNWIKSWIQLYQDTNIPEQYTVWSGIFCVAAAMQNQVYFDRGLRFIYPNLYVWIVGDAATGKSIPAEKACDFLREIPPPSGPFTVHSGELTKIHLLKAMQASCLHKQMSALTRKDLLQKAIAPSIILHSDELAADVGTADFAKDLLKHLVQMYAVPNHYDYGTDKHGLIQIEKPLINWIACTTVPWLQEALPANSAGSGLTARINTITAPFPYRPDEDVKLDEQLVKDLFNDLILISYLRGEFHLEQLATEKRAELKREAFEKRAKITDDIERAQYGREGDQALKVAMALSAAQRDDLIITSGIIESAYQMVVDARESSLDLYISSSGKPLIQLKMLVLKCIKETQVISRTRLGRMLQRKANADELTKVLESLIHEGNVRHTLLPDGTNCYEYLDNKIGGC